MNDKGKEIINMNGNLKRSTECGRIVYSLNIYFPYSSVEVFKKFPIGKTMNGFIVNNPY
jgi:hypothetical protein